MNPKSLITIFISAILYLGCHHSTLAQSSDTVRIFAEDGWIEKMSKYIAFDVSFNNSYETFKIKDSSKEIILYPNIATNLSLTVNYRFISFAYQYAPDFLPNNGDEDVKGKTKSFRLGTSFIFSHWFTELSYSKVKGYYLENTDEFITWVNGDPYIQFPDLHYKGFSTVVGYNSNSRFSLKSVTSQTERQLKSAGSFEPVIKLNYYTLNDKSSQTTGGTTQKSNNLECNIGAGYVYTFVIRQNFFTSLGATANIGYLNTVLTTRFPTGDVQTYQDNLIIRVDGILGLGYNGRKIYSGLYTSFSESEYNQENSSVRNYDTRFFYHIFLGIRLNSPDRLQKLMDDVEKRLYLN